MKTHQLIKLVRHPQLPILLPVCLIIFWVGAQVAAQVARRATTAAASAAQTNCGSSIAGSWASANHDTTLIILARGSARVLNSAGTVLKTLSGEISGDDFRGKWMEDLPEGGRSGTFIANYRSDQHRVDITFFVNGAMVESGVWFCEGGATSTAGSPTPTPEPTATPEPQPPPIRIRDDQDQDNFETFDSMTPEQQEQVLSRRGPRLRVEYDASDLGMRLLLREGSPILLDYGLDSDAAAILAVTVPDHPPFLQRLRPTSRSRLSFIVPFRSRDLVVAKLEIHSVTSSGAPANFELYGLAVGRRGMQALQRLNAPVELARNFKPSLYFESDTDVPLFAPLPQSGISILINVILPTVLRVKQKPENLIEFSCTSADDFSEGRWEWWRVNGLNWRKVWQKGTGSISRNETKSEKWNGIITSRKLVSTGAHALQLTAWERSGSDRDSVVARAPSRLTVIE